MTVSRSDEGPSEQVGVRRVDELLAEMKTDEALAVADELVQAHPTSGAVRGRRAAARARARDYDGAEEDATRAMELDPESAGHRFDRARWRLKAGAFAKAYADFSGLLAHADEQQRRYYRSFVLLLRSFCALQLGWGKEAMRDAEDCDDEGPVWSGSGLVDRAWLMDAARRLLVRPVSHGGSESKSSREPDPT